MCRTREENAADMAYEADRVTMPWWFNPTSRAQIESALDQRMLYVDIGQGGTTFWLARRNGKTQTWKTRPNDFRIPIKFGFRGTHAITQRDAYGYYRIAASREDAEHADV